MTDGRPPLLPLGAQATALPPVCRPQGWAALWRAMAGFSVLSRKAPAFP